MNNPNSGLNRLKSFFSNRWSQPDYPGGVPRFQFTLFAKDLGIHVAVPLFAIIFYRSFSQAAEPKTKRSNPQKTTEISPGISSTSQIIEFGAKARTPSDAGVKRAPGTLVRLRLLNAAETYSATPIHARIVDNGLGNSFLGGLLIGEGSGDGAFDRLNIVFKVARMPNSLEKAFSIQARALSLNGTLGLEASKKEGIFARAAYGASAPGADAISNNEGTLDLKTIVVRALSAGLAQEMGQDAQVEKNRASVLALKPGIEFYAELTDYFPSAAR